MIKISQIDDELSVYKKNIVILIGIGHITKQFIDLLDSHNIETSYICDISDENNWGKYYKGLEIISPIQLQRLIKLNGLSNQSKEIILQISSQNISITIEKQLTSMGFNTIISLEEAWEVLRFIHKFKLVRANPQMLKSYTPLKRIVRVDVETPKAYDYIANNSHLKQFLFICSLQKTGDNTLIKTFKEHNISHHFTLHTPEVLNKDLLNNLPQKSKIIVGVREPIIQNISFMYQHLSVMSRAAASYLLENNQVTPFKNGGDAQYLFDIINNDPYFIKTIPNPVSDFFKRFKDYVLDISKYPFDQEKGYTIICEGNIEVFVYQLEKLNNLTIDISNWIGDKEFKKYNRANISSDKWIANSYKQAQKEIKITQSHFDRCYNCEWINHFYSSSDIEIFKDRWKSHIKN